MKKIHSAIRWNKPLGELAALIASMDQANCKDPRNGNRALHIAAQNGFTPVCKLLIAKGAEVNAVNMKCCASHGAWVRLRRVRRIPLWQAARTAPSSKLRGPRRKEWSGGRQGTGRVRRAPSRAEGGEDAGGLRCLGNDDKAGWCSTAC